MNSKSIAKWNALLIALLALLAAASGCVGGARGEEESDHGHDEEADEEDEEDFDTESPEPTSTATAPTATSTAPPGTTTAGPTPTSSPNETAPTPTAFELRVLILSVSSALNHSDPVNISWRVEASPQDVQVDFTEVRYSNRSFIEFGAENFTAVGRSANFSTPDNFTVEFEDEENRTLYVAAVAQHDGTLYWSEQRVVEFNVTAATIDAGLAFSTYSPDPIRIQVGEAVRWTNDDALDHTATSDEDAPAAFDTGIIESGEDSPTVFFNTAGEYGYHCEEHPSTMSGTIIVEA